MKIGIVSDTHGHINNTIAAVKVLSEYPLEAILHCGDIGSPDVIPFFADWPTHFVFGNCDYDPELLRKTIKDAGQTCHNLFGEIALADRTIALLHSHDQFKFQETIQAEKYDLVCYGHTHKYEKHHAGKTLVLNPGALYRADPHTLAIVDLETMTAEHVVVK